MKEFLKIEGMTKKFGEAYANRDICLTIREGEVHTILGENGAGKSTLMNLLAGLYQPTEGNFYLHGEKVEIENPAKAVRLGIGMVHQHFMLVEAMTVFENIILGATKDRSVFIRKEALKKEIQSLSDRYGLDIELDRQVSEISVGAQQRVEIFKAMYRGAQLLILDEPTAALTDPEVEGLFQIIGKLRAEKKSVIFISHKMREVMTISDRITILRCGETIATLDRSKCDEAGLADLMIGRQLSTETYAKVLRTDGEVISLDKVSFNRSSKHNGLDQVSLTVGKGEVLGIAGVDGNGQSQLAQVMTGVLSPESGEVRLKGKKVRHFTPMHFIRQKVSHIPEDRNRMGLVGKMSVKENLVLKVLERPGVSFGKGTFLRRKGIDSLAERLKERYDIRCASIDQDIRNLSGGNQQKIVFARELEEAPELLVAVHPTRGLDIGATSYVHDRIIGSRDRGCGVVLVSADFDEVLKLSDRIAVMFEGRIVGIYPGKNPPIQEISLAMAGKAK